MRRFAGANRYLFAAEATISDVVEHQRGMLRQRLEEIGSGALLEKTVEELTGEIVDEFRLEVPQLNMSDIKQLPNEEVDIDVSKDPMRGIFDRSQPFYVKGTLLRIAIPFAGDPELFKCGSSPFNSPIPAEIEGNEVVWLTALKIRICRP